MVDGCGGVGLSSCLNYQIFIF